MLNMLNNAKQCYTLTHTYTNKLHLHPLEHQLVVLAIPLSTPRALT